MSQKVLEIDRSKWRCGGGVDLRGSHRHGRGMTRLLNDQGFMCCLGFDALACGVREMLLKNITDPQGLGAWHKSDIPVEYFVTRVAGWDAVPDPPGRSYPVPVAVGDAIDANDAPHLDDATREARVRDALLKLGWDDVVFVGEYQR